ncbi:MAG: hypothetical protein A4E60_01489 [Syntrophorhabdus sp. PtaB.Bin047]|nr:MAG: hypothetical protein A4E60_01489 [Syntrophorhabdus sp. PtaB.Bin047]
MGSPIPMKTIFVTGLFPAFFRYSRTVMTCPTISAALRFLLKPILPVTQNLHPMRQPTCVETQRVTRVFSGMMTTSITCPSLVTRASFVEPSREDFSSAMGRVSRENISEKTLLKLLGMFVISRKSRFPWL